MHLGKATELVRAGGGGDAGIYDHPVAALHVHSSEHNSGAVGPRSQAAEAGSRPVPGRVVVDAGGGAAAVRGGEEVVGRTAT